MEFIDTQVAQYPDLAEKYSNLGVLHEKKLWHQLSLALEEFVSDRQNVRGENMLQLYKGFISSFEARLNQVKFASLASLIGNVILRSQVDGAPAQAMQFLESILAASRTRLGLEASMCLDMDCVRVKLQLGDTASAKALLESSKEQLASIKSSESVAFSKFYRATADYRKVVGPPNEFYNAALMFLAYTPADQLGPEDDRQQLATDMALAAVTGDNIFNFGEVIATPILAHLKGTPNAWLQDLVLAMNSGNVDTFESIIKTYKEQYFAQPVLASKHESVIVEKIRILSLMNIAFERPPHEREIRFSDIAARAKIPEDQVEWILMRALSKGLIKGTMDQVDGTVNITWVQPRVLDIAQLGLLSAQLKGWTEKVKQSLLTIEDQTAELYV